MSNDRNSLSRSITLIATMGALLVASKFILQFIPNVEAVTLLIFTFSAVFGLPRTMAAVLIFITADMVTYPFSPDVAVSYAIYYPSLALIGRMITRASDISAALVAAAATACFGVLTTAMAMWMLGLSFAPTYAAGIFLFAVHIFSNFLIILFAYKPLCKNLGKIAEKFIAEKSQ